MLKLKQEIDRNSEREREVWMRGIEVRGVYIEKDEREMASADWCKSGLHGSGTFRQF